MEKRLRKTFVGGVDNQELPTVLGKKGAIATMLVAFVLLVLISCHGFILEKAIQNDSIAAVIVSVMIDQTNKERQSSDLDELNVSPRLIASAKLKANDMAKNSYFAHTSPTGVSPWFWFEKADYKFNFAGENLAVNFKDSKAVTNAWMNSPTHRANIENSNYSEVGIATSVGKYKGHNTIFVVQHFGDPYPVNGYLEDEVIGLKERVNQERLNALLPESEVLAANVSNVNWVDSLLVQPIKLYSMLFAILALLIIAPTINSLIKIKDRESRFKIAKYSGLSLAVLALVYMGALIVLGNPVVA